MDIAKYESEFAAYYASLKAEVAALKAAGVNVEPSDDETIDLSGE